MSATAPPTRTPGEPWGARMPSLNRDIRDRGNLLGRTLGRQEGEGLLALVERMGLLIREDRTAAAELLGSLEPGRCATPAEAGRASAHLEAQGLARLLGVERALVDLGELGRRGRILRSRVDGPKGKKESAHRNRPLRHC